MSEEVVVNLDNCAREPIHIPGAIQPHGLLFVLREPELTIVQVSENVELVLGIPSDKLLNQRLSSFLSPEQVEKVRFALSSVDPKETNPVQLGIGTVGEESQLDGFVHRYDGLSYLELEPVSDSEGFRFFGLLQESLPTHLQASCGSLLVYVAESGR
jgi:chemotaxis family two-component system sensor kinase Cph1